MRANFSIPDGFTQVDHASFGLYPNVVMKALEKIHQRVENHPGLWYRRDARVELDKVRQILAKFIHADPDDVVMVPQTTAGINAIFRSIKFQPGERILHFDLIFSAMTKLIDYMIEMNNGAISRLVFNTTFPIKNAELLGRFEKFLELNSDPSRPIRLALICHISARPAVLLPITEITKILKRYGIPILVDGAHGIGQVPIDISTMKPDYYVTDCHKWLYSARPCALMYVNKIHQGTLHPSQISFLYMTQRSFQNEFFWTGTTDYGPFLTVPTALKFREEVGGEQRIIEYTHNLAVQGGLLMAQKMGTEMLCAGNDEQIASIVNVRLPVNNPEHQKLQDENWWDIVQFEKYNGSYAVVFKYHGQWWARIAAQIYNELSDFEIAANHFMKICKELNS